MGAGGREFESLRPDHFRFVTADKIIEKLLLERHPEGGWYRRTYQSSERLLLDRGDRFASTSIYYLLAEEEYSALHRLNSDETWYCHAGCGLTVHLFDATGYKKKRLASNPLQGGDPQLTISRGTTFGAELIRPGEWCLISCSVCPGFEHDDFSWADSENLLERFPERSDLIHRLVR